MFSLLAPGAHIPPHTGVANTRLVCHLPLIVPDGLLVPGRRRDAGCGRPGKAWIFDDTIEHEALNPSDALRVHPDRRHLASRSLARPSARRWRR